MRKILTTTIAAGLLSLPLSGTADKGRNDNDRHEKRHEEKEKHEEKNHKGKPSRILLKLAPSNPALTDLTSAKGKVEFTSKKNKTHFKASLTVPFPAASLGIADLAGAGAENLVHIEFSRAEAVIGDCVLELRSESDDEIDTKIKFAAYLHNASKKHGVKEILGSCKGEIPALEKGDQAKAYAVVNSVRVDFLKSPTPEATPTPTPVVP